MKSRPTLLTDQQMQSYIANGYVTIKTDFPREFHQRIYSQAEEILSRGPNPWNDIYPMISELGDVFGDPAVTGALTSILGPGYTMHPHRHCHFNQPGTPAQSQHKDSYEEDQNVRHHRTRWAMAFYYPQDVSADMGPSAVQPGTHYYNSYQQAKDCLEIPVLGQAGTVTIIHYELWHRALKNSSQKDRFMMKFLFCRMEEPTKPTWKSTDAVWVTPTNGQTSGLNHNQLWEQMWRWHRGEEQNLDEDPHVALAHLEGLKAASEAERLNAAYALGRGGPAIVAPLMNAFHAEADASWESNLAQPHTNPSQCYSGYALTAIGKPAIPALTDALSASQWWVRAAAADALGDMGLIAESAVPKLTALATDESEWVRRNAVEALGTVRANARSAVPALVNILLDENDLDWVRHNAALALARFGPAAAEAVPALRQARNHENLYISGISKIALERLGPS